MISSHSSLRTSSVRSRFFFGSITDDGFEEESDVSEDPIVLGGWGERDDRICEEQKCENQLSPVFK